MISVENKLLCMFQRLCTYFQDTGYLYFGGGGGGGEGYVLSGHCSRQQISGKNEGYLFRRGTYLRGFTVSVLTFILSLIRLSLAPNHCSKALSTSGWICQPSKGTVGNVPNLALHTSTSHFKFSVFQGESATVCSVFRRETCTRFFLSLPYFVHDSFSFLSFLYINTGKFLSNVQLMNWKCHRRRNVFEQTFCCRSLRVLGNPWVQPFMKVCSVFVGGAHFVWGVNSIRSGNVILAGGHVRACAGDLAVHGALRGAWRDHCFPEPFSWFLHETGLESLKITFARCFLLKCQRKDLKKKRKNTASFVASLGAGVQPRSTVQFFMPVSGVEKPPFSQFFSRLWVSFAEEKPFVTSNASF